MIDDTPPPGIDGAAAAAHVPRDRRNIVLLSDGTGNSRGKAQQTNVWRVFEALDLKDPADPKTPRQFALYDDGVGSSSFKLWAILGGAFGFGLARNVRDLYAFLCRTWRPGDHIYAFGFSRGAFTIRVLVGLVVSQGIVKYEGDEAELRRLVKAAYREYRKRYRLRYFHYVGALRWLRDTVIAGLARFRGKKAYAEVAEGNHPARITFLGLWDTVDAYGVPVDELGIFINNFIWPFQMPDAKLNDKVNRAVHALALDDERNTFHPKLWDHDPASPTRISQVWFAGMHSDVGGGYADKGLAHVSLKWVIDAARAKDLRFIQTTLDSQQDLSDENGPMNDSRRGIAGYYRYNPRRLAPLLAQHGLARPVVHESVLRRIRVGHDAYAPIVLPPDFDVWLLDGTEPVAAGQYGLSSQQKDGYETGTKRVFNRVWARRCIYFATLLSTLVLLALPLFGSAEDACTSAWCGVSPLIRAFDVVLPAAAAPWTAWYATHPGSFLLLALLAGAGLFAGGVVQRLIFGAMRQVWYALPATRPSTVPARKVGPALGAFDRAVLGLRTAGWYQAVFQLAKRYLLPGIFGLSLVAAVLMLVNGFSFAVQTAGGGVCHETLPATKVQEIGSAPLAVAFDTRALCSATGLRVERGATYEMLLTAPQQRGRVKPWLDADIPADLRGIAPGDTSAGQRLAGLMKREMSQPWLQPMLRIGSKGADVQPLRADPSAALNEPLTMLRMRFVARSSGELFLYVNDAVGPPGKRAHFQGNNEGTGSGTIRLVSLDGSASPGSG